ncbi:MAG: hypothetical protein ABIO44_01350, partial [Saprospiraceae bacterium]
HAFQYVNKVLFHIGNNNVRSQKSIEKLGALKVREINVAYAGELNRPNYEYLIYKEDWPELKMRLETFLYSI